MNVAERVEAVERTLDRAGLHFGHGTDNARDEAAWLVLHVIGAPLDGSFHEWGRELTPEQELGIQELVAARVSQRVPLAYLLGSAWFAGLEFETTADVLVPRSPLAELIQEQFRPWVDPDSVHDVLDLCTGSGCIAIAIALYLPGTRVVAADISSAALRIAKRNIRRHGLESRVTPVESDLFHSLGGSRYDLIVSNPPYVPDEAIRQLPDEYRAEPELGLVSGVDGLDICLSVLRQAPDYLAEGGVLVCEVGESEPALQALLPEVPFVWLEFAQGGSGVFVLTRDQLVKARSTLERKLENRNHVA